MENNENFVPQSAENVENPTEQIPEKKFTQEEVNGLMGKRTARLEAKYDRQYGPLMEVLRAGTGKQSVEEITAALRDHYGKQGVSVPDKPEFSDADVEVLANSDAQKVIREGLEAVDDEWERLNAKGADHMTPRERQMFKALDTHRKDAQRAAQLRQIGVPEDVYTSKEFQEFAGKFTSDTPIQDVYSIYEQTQPQKDIKTMGSMKHTAQDTGVKDYYSFEEADKIPRKVLRSNPALMKAVTESMRKW